MKALTVAAAILLLVSAPTRLLAQDMAGVPDTSYQASSAAPASEASEVPMPDSDPGGDGSVVMVPIPGGGSVTVEGPGMPVDNRPPSPIGTWAESTQTPNSMAGTGPLGP